MLSFFLRKHACNETFYGELRKETATPMALVHANHTLTQGRLVPRQPRAIKRTTRTELHRYNIHNGKYIHGNIGIISAGLYHYNI